MKINELSREEFSRFYKSLNIDPKYTEDFFFNLQKDMINILNSDDFNSTLDNFTDIIPFQLCLYVISDYIYYTNDLSIEELHKKQIDDDFNTLLVSSSLDKYLTIEKIDLKQTLYASKYSTSISTLRLYLRFMTKIVNNLYANEQSNVVVDILLKCFNISRSCLDLLEDGFSSEAFSTWRTLHETECILSLFSIYGDSIVKEYYKHINYSLAFRKLLSQERSDEIFVDIKEEMKKYNLKSKDMKKFIEYGYLVAIPEIFIDPDFKFNFRDGVEKYAGLSRYSKAYEYSSEIAHSSPLMIYSNEKALYHRTLILLYEVFFRIETYFAKIFLVKANENEIQSYKVMRGIHFRELQLIYEKEAKKI